MRGGVATWQDRPDLATATLDQAEAISHGLGQVASAVMAASSKAVSAAAHGQLAEATRLLTGCEAEARRDRCFRRC